MPGVGAMSGQSLGRLFFEMSIVDNGRFSAVLKKAQEQLDAVINRYTPSTSDEILLFGEAIPAGLRLVQV